MKVVLDYTPQPKQELLHRTVAKQLFYGGAAGGGKSHAMRWDAIVACVQNPGCDAYLFRRTRVELENTHIKRLKEEIPPELGRYNETRNRWEFQNVDGRRSYLNMCYAEHEHDVDKYNSVEFHWVGMDEASQFTPYQINYLKSRMRIGSWPPKQDMFPRMILASNPGGPSHTYLKEIFIVGHEPEKLFHDPTMINPDDPEDEGWPSMFIPARIPDNKYLDHNYAAAFGGLPEWRQKQLRDGDWDVIPGAFFESWNPKVHVIEPFRVPEWWPRFRGLDWGFRQPFWVGEFTVSDGENVINNRGESVIYPLNAVICIWEWYGSNYPYGLKNEGLRLDAHDFGRELATRRGRVDYGVAGPDMWRADHGPSMAEKSARGGALFSKADDQRVAGWQECYARLDGGMFYSFKTNKALNQCIPSLVADENKPEDVKKEGEDHPGDGWRYALMSRPMTQLKPKEPENPWRPQTFGEMMRDHMRGRNEPKYRRL